MSDIHICVTRQVTAVWNCKNRCKVNALLASQKLHNYGLFKVLRKVRPTTKSDTGGIANA